MNQSGRSLLEMLGVVTVLGVMTAAAVGGTTFMIDFYQAGTTAVNIEDTTQRATELCRVDCNILGYGNATLCKQKIFAQGCNGDTPLSPWGGTVEINGCLVTDAGALDCTKALDELTVNESYDTFQIVYPNVPERMCERLCDSLIAGFDITGPTTCVMDDDTGIVTAECSGTTTMTFTPF